LIQELKKDPGVPKLVALKKKESAASNAQRTNSKFHQSNKHSKWTGASTDIQMAPVSNPQTIASLAQAAILSNSEEDASTSTGLTRDGTIAAYARHFKKVVELSDVIIQVLDARDPMGTRSKILEAEVLKAGAGEKKMILVLNKIGMTPIRSSIPQTLIRFT
jgi:nuclear GTP-binding protein